MGWTKSKSCVFKTFRLDLYENDDEPTRKRSIVELVLPASSIAYVIYSGPTGRLPELLSLELRARRVLEELVDSTAVSGHITVSAHHPCWASVNDAGTQPDTTPISCTGDSSADQTTEPQPSAESKFEQAYDNLRRRMLEYNYMHSYSSGYKVVDALCEMLQRFDNQKVSSEVLLRDIQRVCQPATTTTHRRAEVKTPNSLAPVPVIWDDVAARLSKTASDHDIVSQHFSMKPEGDTFRCVLNVVFK